MLVYTILGVFLIPVLYAAVKLAMKKRSATPKLSAESDIR